MNMCELFHWNSLDINMKHYTTTLPNQAISCYIKVYDAMMRHVLAMEPFENLPIEHLEDSNHVKNKHAEGTASSCTLLNCYT
jgi:hypothetical protein